MPNENPEFNRVIKPGQHTEAGPEFYDEAQAQQKEVKRNWPTPAEMSQNADNTARILKLETESKQAAGKKPEVSDKVLQYIEELKTSKDPVETLNVWMSKVRQGKMDPSDAAEAMAWSEEQQNSLPKAA